MQLNLPRQEPFAECFEGILACTAQYLNRRYEWMYVNEWRFRFDPPPEGTPFRLGSALELHRAKVPPLAKYHGILYRQQPCETTGELRDVLQVELSKGMPAAARVDAYDCPWDKSFGKYHNANHIVFLHGLEEETGNILFSDPFYQKWDNLVSPDEFKKFYAGQVGLFEITEDRSSSADGLTLFYHMLRSLFDEGTFEAVRRFAKALRSVDISNEISKKDAVWFSPVYRRMMDVANSRGRLSPFTRFMAEQYGQPEFRRLLPALSDIAGGWRQVRDNTLRVLMTGNQEMQERMAQKIQTLAEAEQAAAEEFISILKA